MSLKDLPKRWEQIHGQDLFFFLRVVWGAYLYILFFYDRKYTAVHESELQICYKVIVFRI